MRDCETDSRARPCKCAGGVVQAAGQGREVDDKEAFSAFATRSVARHKAAITVHAGNADLGRESETGDFSVAAVAVMTSKGKHPTHGPHLRHALQCKYRLDRVSPQVW